MYVATHRGLGDQQSAQQGVQFGAAAASASVSAAVAAGLIPVAAIPFVGPIIAGVAILATVLIKNSGCGKTCIQTSQWANEAAELLQQNLDAYRSLPVPRSRANQALALQTFDQVWARLSEMCSDPQWGDAGRRCISDRQRGACTWKDAGECWDWFKGYRDPIANDSNVVDDSLSASSVSGALDSVFGGAGGLNLVPILIIGGLVLLAVKS